MARRICSEHNVVRTVRAHLRGARDDGLVVSNPYGARTRARRAAKGLVVEGKSIVEEEGEGEAKDLLLAGAGRKVEHYEIVSCADAVEHARACGLDDLADLLGETLDEERQADEKLHALGQRLLQRVPMRAGGNLVSPRRD